jgi:hypothetical protein
LLSRVGMGVVLRRRRIAVLQIDGIWTHRVGLAGHFPYRFHATVGKRLIIPARMISGLVMVIEFVGKPWACRLYV